MRNFKKGEVIIKTSPVNQHYILYMSMFKNLSLVIIMIHSYYFIPNKLNIPVNEEMFALIGGIQQWITIKGDDMTKPIILFLHGGPGSVMSPYEETIFKVWQKDFILVHWDQRGAGRTFGKNAPQK